MNILLLYPKIPDTFWSFKHALKFIRKRAGSPPLGLLTVAALLPDHWNKRLVDFNVSTLGPDDMSWADYAFISGMDLQREPTHRLIEQCHQNNLPVVGGGPLFSCAPDKFPEVDHLVLGEAEITLPGFLSDLQAGTPKNRYETAQHPDLQLSPTPDWSLLNMDRYATMSVQYSRGCPYHCEFCNVTTLFGHAPRTKPSAQMIAELNALYSQGWRDQIFFVDDNFIGHRKHLKNDLLPALIHWRETHPEISFLTETSINLADDPELMTMLSQAGFQSVFIGIETPEEACLHEASKSQNQNRDMVADVKRIHQNGIQVQGGFIVGFDNDPPSIFERQIQFIQQSGIVVAMVGLLQAPSGTKLYERLQEAGRLLGFMSGDNVDGSTNILPKMGLDTLKTGYRHILENIYSPKQYYQRLKTFLKDYKPGKVNTSVSREEIFALFRSIFQLGIVGKERLYYWKLFFWTLFRKPKLFPLAITLSIYGYHFRKVCELHVF
ncbi:MAG: Hopanoid C-2 methylase [Candidatus Marinimicrobia bacterium]|nr:Hopanoid C-2 methylase [Candidatus Neomarinimicrobiota bacterium]